MLDEPRAQPRLGIRDAHENDPEFGGDQSSPAARLPQDPPEQTLPLLVLRYEADERRAAAAADDARRHGADRPSTAAR